MYFVMVVTVIHYRRSISNIINLVYNKYTSTNWAKMQEKRGDNRAGWWRSGGRKGQKCITHRALMNGGIIG